MAEIIRKIIHINESHAEHAQNKKGRFSDKPLKPGDRVLICRPLSAKARRHGAKVKYVPGYRVIKPLSAVTKCEEIGTGKTDYYSNAHIRHLPPRPKHLREEDSIEDMFIPESGGAEVIPGKSYADATRPKAECSEAQLKQPVKEKAEVKTNAKPTNNLSTSTSSKPGTRPVQKSSRKRAQPTQSSPRQYSKRSRTQTKPFQASMSGPSHD